MPVPLIDLAPQHAGLRDALVAAFDEILASSGFIGGPSVEAFEREFAAYCEVEQAIAVANGTDALALALRGLGIGQGVAVAVPAFTFAATAEAVCHVGATPLFVDIEPETFTMSAGALREAIRASSLAVKAILPVHLYGQAADMDRLRAVAAETAAVLIEDAAQAHGARYKGRRCGGLGEVAAFSFYPTKNLGALGDGGALTTNDAALAARLRELRDHGQRRKYIHAVVGFNSRLDALQAAALRLKLPRLDAANQARVELADHYRRRLEGMPGLRLPSTAAANTHVFHLFVVRHAKRDSLREYLSRRGIASAIHYPLPLHRQDAFRSCVLPGFALPNAEEAATQVLALPMYPELGPAAVDEVCDAVLAWSRETPQ